VSLVAGDIPEPMLETARLLAAELVTIRVHNAQAPAIIGLFIQVATDYIRIEITDPAATRPELRQPAEDGGIDLDTLADRWDTQRSGDGNLTWFELDLPAPGAAQHALT
jgi:hypothetical protein